MITLRPAEARDEEPLGRFGGALMREHHATDPRRFIQVDHPEAAYGRFLISQMTNSEGLVLVAEQAGRIVGYVFAALEPTSWMELRGPCGVIHDLYVNESARRLGAGRLLLTAALEWIHAQGRSQTVLLTKTDNEHAQALFRAVGFRSTMIEMTRDQD